MPGQPVCCLFSASEAPLFRNVQLDHLSILHGEGDRAVTDSPHCVEYRSEHLPFRRRWAIVPAG